MNKNLLTIIFLVVAFPLLGQQEGTLHFMSAISQARYNNPALAPQYQLNIGLPGISSNYISAANSGFNYNNIFSRRTEDDSLIVDLISFYNSLKEKNYLNVNASLDLMHLAFKLNPRIHLMLNVSQKMTGRIMYPQDLAGLLINGNASLINQTMHLSPEVESSGYLEVGVGGSYKVDRNITVGARLKILKGLFNITTEKADFTLHTDPDYNITIAGEAQINTSGINQLEDLKINSFKDATALMAKNNGAAIDLGATYQVLENLSIGLSLVDIGSIKWNNDLTSQVLENDVAYTFKGFDLAKVLEGDDVGFTESLDSLTETLEFKEVTGKAYRTVLPKKVYLSGDYEFIPNLRAGLLFYSEMHQGRFNGGVSSSLIKDFGRLMSLSLSYSVNNHSYNNLGAGISFNFSPVQLYFVGDNTLRAPLTLATQKELNPFLNSTKNFNLRFGMNLIFGYSKKQDRISSYPEF
ncbi:MAG: DUF5723 family protein [Candidatus Cyclobacteriaceae bacterium M3_2C_046]